MCFLLPQSTTMNALGKKLSWRLPPLCPMRRSVRCFSRRRGREAIHGTRFARSIRPPVDGRRWGAWRRRPLRSSPTGGIRRASRSPRTTTTQRPPARSLWRRRPPRWRRSSMGAIPGRTPMWKPWPLSRTPLASLSRWTTRRPGRERMCWMLPWRLPGAKHRIRDRSGRGSGATPARTCERASTPSGERRST